METFGPEERPFYGVTCQWLSDQSRSYGCPATRPAGSGTWGFRRRLERFRGSRCLLMIMAMAVLDPGSNSHICSPPPSSLLSTADVSKKKSAYSSIIADIFCFISLKLF